VVKRQHHQKGSALVTVLALVVVLATVVACLATSVHVECVRSDAVAARRARELAALSAVQTAAALLQSADGAAEPLWERPRQLEMGPVRATLVISDQAGKLPLTLLYGAADPSQRNELCRETIQALVAGRPIAGTGADGDNLVLSRPPAREGGGASTAHSAAEDLALAAALADLGCRPEGLLYDATDLERANTVAPGRLFRSGGPLAVNVNTAPAAVLGLVLASRGFAGELPALLAARRTKPFVSLDELRERHVLSDDCLRAVGPLLATSAGPVCVCVEVELDGTRETFAAFLACGKDGYQVERFAPIHESLNP